MGGQGERNFASLFSTVVHPILSSGNLNGVDNKDEAAAARTNNSIPPICGVYYYEVEVLDRGNKG